MFPAAGLNVPTIGANAFATAVPLVDRIISVRYRTPVLEQGLRVTGHRVIGSTILAGSGRVTVSVTDPVSHPVF